MKNNKNLSKKRLSYTPTTHYLCTYAHPHSTQGAEQYPPTAYQVKDFAAMSTATFSAAVSTLANEALAALPQDVVLDNASAQQLWQRAQNELKNAVGADDHEAWLGPLQAGATAEGGLQLQAPTSFIANWVEKHLLATVRQVVEKTAGTPLNVQVIVRGIVFQNPVLPASPAAAAAQAVTVAAETAAPPADSIQGSRLDPRFTFATFVNGTNNQFAFAAAKRVAEGVAAGSADAHTFNPFFLHGSVGLGKTHLMHAVGHEVMNHRPGTRILYLTAEQFLQTFVRAIRDRTTLAFKDACRNVDVLMIDDLQFIAGKDSTQEEFFHTFNTLVGMGKQVILTADKSPHELPGVEDRLKSRLGCGLTVEVHTPDVETRLAILQKKAAAMDLDLPPEVSMLLATTIASNVRELEGALNRLAAFSKLTGTGLTTDFAREQLRDLFRVNTRLITIDDIQKQVAEFFTIRVADMHTPRRSRDVARPRQVAMYLSKTLTSRSYPDIGRAFGGRDHTTVMHACEQIKNLMEKDRELAENVRLLEKMLGSSR